MKQFTESAEALPRLASLPTHPPQIFLEKARRDWQSPHASFFLPAMCVSKGVEPQAEPQGSVSCILLLEVALRQGTHSPSWLPEFPLRQYKMLLLCHVQLFHLFFFFFKCLLLSGPFHWFQRFTVKKFPTARKRERTTVY